MSKKQTQINLITPQPEAVMEPFFFPETCRRSVVTNRANRDWALHYGTGQTSLQTFTDGNTRRWYFMDIDRGGNKDGIAKLEDKSFTVATVVAKEAMRATQISDRSLYGAPRLRPHM